MQVYKYNNLDDLNAALQQFEVDGLKVLAVKIFLTKGDKTVLGDKENYFVIVDRFYTHPGDRFQKN